MTPSLECAPLGALAWRTSSYSSDQGGSCVEIARRPVSPWPCAPEWPRRRSSPAAGASAWAVSPDQAVSADCLFCRTWTSSVASLVRLVVPAGNSGASPANGSVVSTCTGPAWIGRPTTAVPGT
ncbi:DUF397 domain-containing protein [Streptomyces sp. NPDC055140]